MAAKIRLSRTGLKKQPTYRIVVQDESSKRDGRYVENLGYYNPRSEPTTLVMNHERVNYWLGVGAQPTNSMGRLLKIAGITDKYYKQLGKTNVQAAEAPATEAAPATAAPETPAS